MQHITIQEDNRVRHEYYLDKDMELPLERRKPYYVCYTYKVEGEVREWQIKK